MDTTETIGSLPRTESARVVLKKPERLGWECKGQEKSIKLENCRRWVPLVFLHQARVHSIGEAEYFAAISATSEAMLIREVLLLWD